MCRGGRRQAEGERGVLRVGAANPAFEETGEHGQQRKWVPWSQGWMQTSLWDNRTVLLHLSKKASDVIYDVVRTTIVRNFYFLSLVCCCSDSQNIDAHSAGLSPGGSMVKNLPASSGDLRAMGLTPGSGRSPREGNGNPLQYSCLENAMERGAWRATVHKVAKSCKAWTCLKKQNKYTYKFTYF